MVSSSAAVITHGRIKSLSEDRELGEDRQISRVLLPHHNTVSEIAVSLLQATASPPPRLFASIISADLGQEKLIKDHFDGVIREDLAHGFAFTRSGNN